MKRTSSDANLTRKTPKAKRKIVYPLSPALQMQVDREVDKRIERKTNKRYFDLVQNSATAITYNGSVYSLTNGIARGDADNNFEGNTIFPKWLQIRAILTQPSGVTQFAEVVRVIVGQQIRAATVPTAANLLQSVGTNYAALQPKNNDYSNSFRILYDKIIELENTIGAGAVSNAVPVEIFIPGRKLAPIEFIAANTTPVVGDLFIAFFGCYAPAASNNVQGFVSRFKFSN